MPARANTVLVVGGGGSGERRERGDSTHFDLMPDLPQRGFTILSGIWPSPATSTLSNARLAYSRCSVDGSVNGEIAVVVDVGGHWTSWRGKWV